MKKFLAGAVVGAILVATGWWLDRRVRHWDAQENMQ